MTLDVLRTLQGNHLGLWATTYTLEPGVLDEFLFRQLGEPPLNVNILVDAGRIAKVWEEWADQPWRFRRVNRDYLVRSVNWAGGAFHPKTYLLADKRDGVLLVGSGNLGLRGLIEGKEVFCRFSSATDSGRAAIGSWRVDAAPGRRTWGRDPHLPLARTNEECLMARLATHHVAIPAQPRSTDPRPARRGDRGARG